MRVLCAALAMMAIAVASASADKLDDIIASGKLRCAVVLDFPPMGSRDEPVTHLTLEPPAGLVSVKAHCRAGKAERIEVTKVPSFADRPDAPLEVEGTGTLLVDTAYGGDSFVIVDARSLGSAITPDEANDIAELGVRIVEAANDQLGFRHPTKDWNHISFCQMTAPLMRVDNAACGLNAVAIRPGKIDRSPCGTGCSARMAGLRAKGALSIGDRFIGRSIIGSQFDCRLEKDVMIGEKWGIVPVIAGQAWITGIPQHTLDPTDPYPTGYRLSDTWPRADRQF